MSLSAGSTPLESNIEVHRKPVDQSQKMLLSSHPPVCMSAWQKAHTRHRRARTCRPREKPAQKDPIWSQLGSGVVQYLDDNNHFHLNPSGVLSLVVHMCQMGIGSLLKLTHAKCIYQMWTCWGDKLKLARLRVSCKVVGNEVECRKEISKASPRIWSGVYLFLRRTALIQNESSHKLALSKKEHCDSSGAGRIESHNFIRQHINQLVFALLSRALHKTREKSIKQHWGSDRVKEEMGTKEVGSIIRESSPGMEILEAMLLYWPL
nr:hypothetical protein Iba_chr04eCG15570 [Ipomoea batatas]